MLALREASLNISYELETRNVWYFNMNNNDTEFNEVGINFESFF